MLFSSESIFFHEKFVDINYCLTFATTLIAEAKNKDPVVQLVRMPPCHGGGRGFESRPDRTQICLFKPLKLGF